MRISAIIPVILSIAAFILSLLVLLSGRNTNFLNDVYLLQINTTSFGANSSSNINGVSSTVVGSAAKRLGLHDYYDAHIMSYCSGDNKSGSFSENVTHCSKPKAMYWFDPVSILQKDLSTSVTLEQLGFPTADVNKAVTALRAAYKAMFVTYIFGVVSAVVCAVMGLLGVVFTGRLASLMVELLAMLSFLSLAIASTIVTVIAIKIKNVLNDKLASLSVTANGSPKLLGMTWAATGLMLFVALYWCGACCAGRKENSKRRVFNEKGSGDDGVALAPKTGTETEMAIAERKGGWWNGKESRVV